MGYTGLQSEIQVNLGYRIASHIEKSLHLPKKREIHAWDCAARGLKDIVLNNDRIIFQNDGIKIVQGVAENSEEAVR